MRHPSRAVFVFPGQGAYRSDVLPTLAARSAHVRATFEEIDEVLDRLGERAVSPTLLGPQPPTLRTLLTEAPDALQIAIFGTDYVLYRALLDAGVRPDVLVGHSFGEIPALVAAGAYTLRQGAEIVARRTAVLRELAPTDGAMIALGCGVARAEHLVAALADPATVVAVENGPGQTVASGPRRSIDALAEAARAVGMSATVLLSPWAFHSPQLGPLVGELAARIAHLSPAPATVPVYSPILGRYLRAGDDVAGHLARSLVAPVRFGGGIAELGEGSDARFYECGASDALTGRIRRILPAATAIPALDALDAAADDGTPSVAPVVQTAPVPASQPAVAQPVETAAAVPASQPAVPQPVETAAAVPASQPAVLQPVATLDPVSSVTPASRPALFAELAAMYAEALEYPVEVFTETVGLEADLGIDSVKQTELLARAADRYGLPAERPEGFRLSDHDTMGKVVDYVWSMRGSVPTVVQSSAQPAPVTPVLAAVPGLVPAQAAAPAAETIGPDVPQTRSALFAELAAMYAEALEYPVEVFTETVGLEADLGIDSVKQTELLARAADRYGLPAERPEGFRLSDHDTMGKVVDYLWSTRAAVSAVAA